MLNLKLMGTIMFIISLVFLIYIINGIKTKKNRLAIVFILMATAMFAFSLGYGVELTSTCIRFGILSIKFQYFGLAFLPIFWYILAFKFHNDRYPKFYSIILISIIPLISFFLVMTNELHYLYYKSLELVPYNNGYIVRTEKTFFYYLFIFYSYLVLIYGLYSFFYTYKKSKESLKFQSKLMLIGTIWPVITNLLYLFGFTPANFDPTPIGFLLMTHFFYLAIFKYDYLDLREIVRFSIFDRVSDGIIVLDYFNRLIDANSVAGDMFKDLEVSNIGDNLEKYPIGKKILVHKNEDSFEVTVINSAKLCHYEFQKTNIVHSNKNIGYIYLFKDITGQKELISDLSFLATHDYLTGLCNRMNFIQNGEIEHYRVKRYGGEYCLIIIDIDFFKKINDTHGHCAGDEVLRELCKIIGERLRISDIFARYGGEEFIILLPETKSENAINIAEDIRIKVEKTIIRVNNHNIKITISLGVTQCAEKTSESFQYIINNSDRALYLAKARGRNRTEFK